MKLFDKKLVRRKFFVDAGKTMFGAAFLALIPSKVISLIDRSEKKVKVKIHPSAVKRNK